MYTRIRKTCISVPKRCGTEAPTQCFCRIHTNPEQDVSVPVGQLETFRGFVAFALCAEDGVRHSQATPMRRSARRFMRRSLSERKTPGNRCNELRARRTRGRRRPEPWPRRCRIRRTRPNARGSWSSSRGGAPPEPRYFSSTALMRRTPAEEDSSFLILKCPRTPVCSTCGPVQTSLEKKSSRVRPIV